MNKTLSIIIAIILVGVIGFIALRNPDTNTPPSALGNASENVVIRDGVQYITINARGGYSPRSSAIQSGIPTKLIMKTNNTYDCSSSLVVRSANYRGMLPANGETEIDLGTPKAGTKIQGTCSMGMYSFTLNIN